MASSILNLRGQPIVSIPETILYKEPTFVSRYWLVAEIITRLAAKDLKNDKIIDVGGYGSILPEILGREVSVLDLPQSDDKNYIQASALKMPLADKAYTFVTACDVYEHIPEKDRVKFIGELLRVSSEYVILCGPMYKKETAAAEVRANDFFKEIFDRDHPWLQEHIDYGLPKEEDLENLLAKAGLKFCKFEHGELWPWELTTKMNLLLVANDISGDKRLGTQINKLNYEYNKELKNIDFPIRGYRTIYIIQTDKQKPSLRLQLPQSGERVSARINTLSTDILAKLAVTFRSSRAELLNIQEDLDGQNAIVQRLRSELDAVYSSRSWQLTSVIRRLALPVVKIMRKLRLIGPAKRVTRASTKSLLKIPVARQSVLLARSELRRRRNLNQREIEYQQWLRRNKPTPSQLEEQKKLSALFKHQPLISIILPTYNTNVRFLRECLDSVIAQSYPKWELCIADDASTNSEVRWTIGEYAKTEPRIKYVLRKKNGHICEASNSALELASGKYVALLDHDDILWPNALYEIVREINTHPQADFIYSDEEKVDESSTFHSQPFFKPSWSPDFLRSINYITHLAVIRKTLVDQAGGFRKGYEGAQDWDLFLRVSRLTKNIFHIPKILYSWRQSPVSTALDISSKSYAYDSQQKTLLDDGKVRGLKVKSIEWAVQNLTWNITYQIKGRPKVSIIIPTKDKYKYMKKCLSTIKKRTIYGNFEIVIIDTGSEDKRVWKLYKYYQNKFKNLQIYSWKEPFNFAMVCNFGAQNAKGEYLLFLNNDTEIISPHWIEGLLQFAQQPHIGAVGSKLLYPDGSLQHAGVVLGVGGDANTPGVAGHLFSAYQDKPFEDWEQNLYAGGVRNFSAVTAACMMVEKDKFIRAGGFDSQFKIAWNDIDFCLKLRKMGLFNVYTPNVVLYHNESTSIGKPGSRDRDLDLFNKEIKAFGDKWGWDYINNDPFYSPNFRKDTANARLELSL